MCHRLPDGAVIPAQAALLVEYCHHQGLLASSELGVSLIFYPYPFDVSCRGIPECLVPLGVLGQQRGLHHSHRTSPIINLVMSRDCECQGVVVDNVPHALRHPCHLLLLCVIAFCGACRRGRCKCPVFGVHAYATLKFLLISLCSVCCVTAVLLRYIS